MADARTCRIVHDGKMHLKATVRGREEIKVPAGTFKDCVKIDLEQAWPEKQKPNKGAVWLAPGVGVVKWLKVTGRLDDLVSYKIPAK